VQQGGFTPLHEAVLKGDAEAVKLLLEHGADPTIRNEKGETSFSIAEDKNLTDILDLLIKCR
jgi:ankyrin repeat protein